ncbi:inositol 2-dehydrogenase [Rhizobium etli]|uniref:inositol 2-dehydrogenase n=1 Tax=Rhizobium etli TaxID=29449 RepID=UPI000383914F|nr:inositol 2-dehydrogenase [Rhizobium etli]AGS24372.1 myo-inositol 2-dehydrogenase protein [Rhizobium etli bv. mimosae str. Mim1]AGS25158.1 myo-inositol 2-dehydrogenase 2 [Rhizobium etli bv. mimosae str. Mim1]
MTKQKVTVALIGAGFIGELHAKNLARHADVELKYVVEPTEALGRKVSELTSATWLASAEEAYGDASLQAVWIASPASTHTDFIRRAAKAGKAIFCEKPVGMDMQDVDQLVSELHDYKQPILIGFNRRFDASHARLKEIVDSGAIGEVEMVSITSRDPNPPPPAYMKATPGGIFYDTMIHDFDIARWVLGAEATEVYATASSHLNGELNPDREFDAATATLKTASGAVCQVSASRRAVYGYDQRIEVFGSKGMVQSKNHGKTNVQVYGAEAIHTDPLKNFFIDRYADAYVLEIDYFIAAVRGNASNYPTVWDGRQALHISMEALKSARSGQPVSLS